MNDGKVKMQITGHDDGGFEVKSASHPAKFKPKTFKTRDEAILAAREQMTALAKEPKG